MKFAAKTRVVGRSLDALLREADKLATQFAGDRDRTIVWPETIESGRAQASDSQTTPEVVFFAEITITVSDDDAAPPGGVLP